MSDGLGGGFVLMNSIRVFSQAHESYSPAWIPEAPGQCADGQVLHITTGHLRYVDKLD